MQKLRIDNWTDWVDFTSGGIFSAILGAEADYLLPKSGQVCCYGARYSNPVTDRYIDMLLEFTGFEAAALFSTGSEATEAFWRCMRIYSSKPGIWGGLVNPDEVGGEKPICDAMHGWTLGALIMAGRMSWPELGVFPELGASRFGQMPDMTCGMIMEPYHAPSAQWHKVDPTINRVKSLQKEFPAIPLCLDEIQAGFGRTGKLFGYEWYEDFRPDFVCVGKAMGGGLPLAALLGPKEILEDDKVLKAANLHSTHSGNPAMCYAGIEVLLAIQEQNLIQQSYEKGLLFAHLLQNCGVRVHAGRGLLAGLEFESTEMASEVAKRCQERQLLVVDTGRKWVKLGPPFTIPIHELETGSKILKEVIEEVKDAHSETCGDQGGEP